MLHIPKQEPAESRLWASGQEGGSREASLDPCVHSQAEGSVNRNHGTTNHNDLWSVLANVWLLCKAINKYPAFCTGVSPKPRILQARPVHCAHGLLSSRAAAAASFPTPGTSSSYGQATHFSTLQVLFAAFSAYIPSSGTSKCQACTL